jgi:hypothetical protein
MRANVAYRFVHQNHHPLWWIEGFALEADFVMSDFGIGFEREVVDMGDNTLTDESCDLAATAIPQ